MRRMSNGIPILYENKTTETKYDEYRVGAGYNFTVTVRLIWKGGFFWMIDTGDFSVCEKGLFALPKIVPRAMQMLHDDSPRYYRLKTHLIYKGFWRSL